MILAALQVGALLLTLESAFFLTRGSLVLTPAVIVQISGTYYDYNAHLVDSLAHQTADAWVGMVLLLGSALCQMAALWHGPRMRDIGPANRGGIALAAALSLVIFIGAYFASEFRALSVATETQDAIRAVDLQPLPQE